MHPFAKRLKMVCLIVTWRSLGQSTTNRNSAILECRSALQKCQIGSWRLNPLSCSGAISSLLLGFFGRSLYLVVFPTYVYDFFILFFYISFLDNSGFFKSNYLKDKYLKINLDKVQIIYSFIVIQLSILFPWMHPYFKH